MFGNNLGNREIRKYLYGVEFLLETDHKHLSYLQTAKVLNPESCVGRSGYNLIDLGSSLYVDRAIRGLILLDTVRLLCI